MSTIQILSMTQYHVVTVQTVEAKGTFINDVIMSYHQGPAKGEQLSDTMKRDESTTVKVQFCMTSFMNYPKLCSLTT